MLIKIYVIFKNRFSELNFIGHKKIQNVKPRSAIIAFNLIGLYEIAEQIRSLKGGVALVAGALSPKTRNSQVKLYEDGEVDYIVATDAIGMGLNLDINQVYFSGLEKFVANGANFVLFDFVSHQIIRHFRGILTNTTMPNHFLPI